MADLYAKAAAENTADTVSKRTLQEASLAHVSRSATEAINTSKTAKWIKTHVKAERRYRPPNGKGRRQELKGERKAREPLLSVPTGKYCNSSLPVRQDPRDRVERTQLCRSFVFERHSLTITLPRDNGSGLF